MQHARYWQDLIKRGTTRFLMLAALAEQPRHGYELSQCLQEECGDCCGASYAMIYPALRELSEGGYIYCNEVANGGRVRKVCGLTPKGVEAYRAAGDAWATALPSLTKAVERSQNPSTAPQEAN